MVGAMVLGKIPLPGRPSIWIIVGQGPTALAVGAGGVVWTFLLSSILSDIFTLIYPLSSLSPSLWETAQCRLKYCLKGPLNPKQPNNCLKGPLNPKQPSNQPKFHKTFNLQTKNAKARTYCACSWCALGVVWTFSVFSILLSSFSFSLGDGPI